MTRETKIGLLVGLAFIIVIGILLSDHFTSTTAPLQASATTAMESTRGGIATPDSSSVTRPNVDTTLRNAPDVPVEIVPPTSTPQANPSTVIIVPPASARDPMVVTPPVVEPTPEARRSNEQILNQIPEALRPHLDVPHGPVVSETPTRVRPEADDHEDPLPTMATRQYKVQDGDTVSKIARKMMGSDSPANLKLIAEINGMKDAHRIRIGQTLNIPSSAPAPATAAPSTAAPAVPDSSVKPQMLVQSPAAQPEAIYTTKPGDTLWRIAVDQCGGPGMVRQLRELNRDVLRNGDTIRPNMKLRLPPKEVASAE